MENYEKIISHLKMENPILEIIKGGVKPEELKEYVIKILGPYFENKTFLEKYADNSILITECGATLKLKKSERFFRVFEECLNTYKKAKIREPGICLKNLAKWEPVMREIVSKYWSIYKYEHLYLDIDLEDFLHLCLSSIGDIIEGVTKPYIKFHLQQTKLAKGIIISLEEVNHLELGKAVHELIGLGCSRDILKPPPWGVRLNQWRNIADHRSARIENNFIVCSYSKHPNIKEIRLSKGDLLKVYETVFWIYSALKLAFSIFYSDNFEEIIKRYPVNKTPFRREVKFVDILMAISAEGFEIVELKDRPEGARLVVKDIIGVDPWKRALHASQFVIATSAFTEREYILVEYRNNDNKPLFLFKASSELCKKIHRGDKEISELARTISIISLETGEEIPPLNLKSGS